MPGEASREHCSERKTLDVEHAGCLRVWFFFLSFRQGVWFEEYDGERGTKKNEERDQRPRKGKKMAKRLWITQELSVCPSRWTSWWCLTTWTPIAASSSVSKNSAASVRVDRQQVSAAENPQPVPAVDWVPYEESILIETNSGRLWCRCWLGPL